MILAVNVGNTNIRVAVGDQHRGVTDQTVFSARADLDAAAVAAAVEAGLGATVWERATACIVASVVPALTERIAALLYAKTNKEVRRVTVQNAQPLNLRAYQSPLGEDRIVCARRALEKYALPLVVIDCGTATTINVVDEERTFLGGAIMPGVQIGLDALSRNTAQLPALSFLGTDIPVVGRTSAECLSAGAVIGLACALEGYLARIRRELNAAPHVIMTGGHAPVVLPYCRFDYTHEPDLLLEGLFSLV